MKPSIAFLLVLLSCAYCEPLFTEPSGQNDTLIIDYFSEGAFSVDVTGQGFSPFVVPETSETLIDWWPIEINNETVLPETILGGERDLILSFTGPTSDVTIGSWIGDLDGEEEFGWSTFYSENTSLPFDGYSSLQWDGLDNRTAANSKDLSTGLGGLDITNEGKNKHFHLRIWVQEDSTRYLTLTVASEEGECTYNIPENVTDGSMSETDIWIAFDDFTQNCNWTNVGGIEITRWFEGAGEIENQTIRLSHFAISGEPTVEAPEPSETPSPTPSPLSSETPSPTASPLSSQSPSRPPSQSPTRPLFGISSSPSPSSSQSPSQLPSGVSPSTSPSSSMTPSQPPIWTSPSTSPSSSQSPSQPPFSISSSPSSSQSPSITSTISESISATNIATGTMTTSYTLSATISESTTITASSLPTPTVTPSISISSTTTGTRSVGASPSNTPVISPSRSPVPAQDNSTVVSENETVSVSLPTSPGSNNTLISVEAPPGAFPPQTQFTISTGPIPLNTPYPESLISAPLNLSIETPFGKLRSTVSGEVAACFQITHTANIADVCLAWLNPGTDAWQCVDSRLVKNENNYCGNTMHSGLHGIIDNVILRAVQSASPLPTPNFIFSSLQEILPFESYERYYSAISIPDYIFSFSLPNPVVPHFNSVMVRDDDDDDDRHHNSALMLSVSTPLLVLIVLTVFF